MRKEILNKRGAYFFLINKGKYPCNFHYMILKFPNFSEIFLEIFNIFFVHLLFCLLELFHPDYLVITDFFCNFTDKFNEFICLLNRQEDFSMLSKIPELLTAFLEFLK